MKKLILLHAFLATMLTMTSCTRQETESHKDMPLMYSELAGTWGQACSDGDIICFHENGHFYSIYFPELCGKEYRLSDDTLSFLDNQDVVCKVRVGVEEEENSRKLIVREIIQRYWPMSGSQYHPACEDLTYIQLHEPMTVTNPQSISEFFGTWKRIPSAFHYSEENEDLGDTIFFENNGTFLSWFGTGTFSVENGIVFFDFGSATPMQSKITMMLFQDQSYMLCYMSDPTTIQCVVEPIIYTKLHE